MEQFDLLVIGAGPGGYSSAIEAAKAGLKVAVFEKDNVGGTCLNVGCIPTKYLLDKALAMDKIRNLTGDGIFKDAGLFSYKKIQAGKDAVVGKLTGGVSALFKANGIQLVKGEAALEKGCKVSCNGSEYEGKNIIIATGSHPFMVPISGVENTIDSTKALSLQQVPKRFCVIGGGVIGLELASAFASFGSDVTVLEMLPDLLPKELPEAVKVLKIAIKKHGLNVITGAKVLSAARNGAEKSVSYEKDGKTETIAADEVLMAIGRKPSLNGIDAKAIGLEVDKKGFISVNDKMQTSLEGVYAIGDVCGGYQLAHAAYAEGEVAVSNILGISKTLDVSIMPRCIFTIPCFSAVGITTEQAKEQGFDPVVGSFNYQGNGMALAEGASGSVFVIMDRKTKTTLGIQIVGENASEMVSFASSEVANHTSLDQWERKIVAHPSLSEMVKEAALDAFKLAVHKI
jgi:dihydrolipoamide dehydrogenase